MKKILLAEDDVAVRSLLAKELQQKGFTVLEAGDGITAKEIITTEKPDCIVLDVILPKKHGMEILQELNEDSWGKKVPVVLLTNVADDPRVMSLAKKRGCPLLSKAGISLDDLLSTITKQVS